jgi:Uri superfamily endonuclease
MGVPNGPEPMPRSFSMQIPDLASDWFYAMADRIPATPGAYLLLVKLRNVTFVKLPNRPSVSLVPGDYIYAGSANGPGGLKARVSRYMLRGKRRRWHIDELTETGDVLRAWIFPGGSECDLVDVNSALPIPIAGFGSTDCKRCRSYLLGPTSAVFMIQVALRSESPVQ